MAGPTAFLKTPLAAAWRSTALSVISTAGGEEELEEPPGREAEVWSSVVSCVLMDPKHAWKGRGQLVGARQRGVRRHVVAADSVAAKAAVLAVEAAEAKVDGDKRRIAVPE